MEPKTSKTQKRTANKSGKGVSQKSDIQASPDRLAEQLEALVTAAHMLTTEVIQDGGPFAHPLSYEEGGRPDSDSRDAIENAHAVVTVAAQLMQMAYDLTFPVRS